jgi:hypothetical protein
VKEILADLNYWPDVFWTMDVCEHQGHFRVMEINSLLTAGWYDCDVSRIVEEVEKEVLTISNRDV